MCNWKFCTIRSLCYFYNNSLANPRNISGIFDLEKVVCPYGDGHYGERERLFDYCKECGEAIYITEKDGICDDCRKRNREEGKLSGEVLEIEKELIIKSGFLRKKTFTIESYKLNPLEYEILKVLNKLYGRLPFTYSNLRDKFGDREGFKNAVNNLLKRGFIDKHLDKELMEIWKDKGMEITEEEVTYIVITFKGKRKLRIHKSIEIGKEINPKEKIKAIKFHFEDSELQNFKEETVNSWKKANKILEDYSLKIKKDELGVRKTIINIHYEDGFIYRVKYELVSFIREFPNLGKHIYDVAMLYSGRRKPAHLSDKMYKDFLASSRDAPDFYNEFLDNYEIIK